MTFYNLKNGNNCTMPNYLLAKNIRIKENAINLLKEIRIISGINERKYYKSSDVQVSNEFNYINHMIDKFKYKFELKGFKK